MRRVTWSDPSSATAKISGLALALNSQFGPGFCDFSVEGQVAAPLTTEALASLPPSVIADVQRAVSPGIGTVRRIGVCRSFARIHQRQ